MNVNPKDPILKNRRPKANFYQRLLNPNRRHLRDWENPDNIATHKISYITTDDGNAIVFPFVQEVNGNLIDYTQPPYNPDFAINQAIKTGDTIQMSAKDAAYWTENYKDFYPGFKKRRHLDD